jgi:RNA polymerase sigma factor (sigma-70 family)
MNTAVPAGFVNDDVETPGDEDTPALVLDLLMLLTQRRCGKSFRRLHQSTRTRILRTILKINRDRADAEEILQDVFVVAWDHADRFDPAKGTAMAWLTTIARRKAVSSLRRRSCRLKSLSDASATRDSDEEQAGIACEAAQPPESVARSRAALALHGCIESLHPEHRSSLVMAFFEGLTHAEIAIRMGKPVGTVKTWIRRSMQSMRLPLAAH